MTKPIGNTDMNNTLIKFCEVESRASEIYSKGYTSKEIIYDQLKSEFGRSYLSILLLGIEAAAESWNFHDDAGPWLRDLKEKAGFFTNDDLISTREYVKYN